MFPIELQDLPIYKNHIVLYIQYRTIRLTWISCEIISSNKIKELCMKNTIKWFGIIAFVAVIGFTMASCASGPTQIPSQEKIQELLLNDGTYGPLNFSVSGREHRWFMVQPIVSGDLHFEMSNLDGFARSIAFNIVVFDSNNRIIANESTHSLVIPVVAGGSYFFRVDFRVDPFGILHGSISAFNEAQRAEARRLAEEERLRVEAERAEAQARQRAEQEQARQAEQARLANLYQQAGNNLGNLRNTSRSFINVHRDVRTFHFGDGNFISTGRGVIYLFHRRWTGWEGEITGNFRVNGDTVIFRSHEGIYDFGTIIGLTLTIGRDVFR